MAVEFYIHKMSEHMDEAEIVQWLAAEGDTVREHQPIVEVMTDKFAVELEAPAAGVLAGIRPGCDPGTVVPVGEAIAYIVQPGEQAPSLPPFAAGAGTATGTPPAAPQVAPAANGDAVGRVKSTPVARRMAKDLGIDIEELTGTGPTGRVTEADVKAAVQTRDAARSAPSAPPAVAPAAPAAPPAAGAWQELTPFQRITGERMRESVVNAPQFALDISVDATNLQWLREALNDRVTLEARARLSLTGLLVKIVAAALRDHPRVNAEYAGGKIKLHDAVNIGVAVGTDQGLAVPVVKQADARSLAQITAELAAFQEKARTRHFSADDLRDGTFTLSNLGMYGVERFNAILNPPQSAILAVGAVIPVPVVLPNGTLGAQPRMNLTLTVDHRVLDGVQGARFLADVKARIEKPFFVI